MRRDKRSRDYRQPRPHRCPWCAPQAKLRAILKYHVVSGQVMAADVAKLTSAKTLLGQTLAIDASKGVRVNEATVTTAEIKCKNGVIHVIDTVLLPK